MLNALATLCLCPRVKAVSEGLAKTYNRHAEAVSVRKHWPHKARKSRLKVIASIFILYLSVLCVRRLINSAYKHVNNSGGIYLKTCAV